MLIIVHLKRIEKQSTVHIRIKKDRAIVVFLFKCKKSLEGNVEITWPPRHSVRIRAPLHTLQCHGQRSTIIRLSQAKERVKVTTFRTKFKL